MRILLRRPVMLAAALLLVACTSPGTSSSPEPSASLPVASEAPSASAVPSPSPTPPVEGAQLPGVGCCVGMQLEPGRYATPRFVDLPMSVAVGDGWRGMQNANDGVVFFLQGSNDVHHSSRWLGLFAVTPTVGQAFLDDLRLAPLLSVGATEATSLAGLTGTRTDLAADPNPGEPGRSDRVAGAIVIPSMRLISNISHGWFTESSEARLRIYLLDATAAYQVLVYVEAPPVEFDDFVTAVEQVLDTLQLPAAP